MNNDNSENQIIDTPAAPETAPAPETTPVKKARKPAAKMSDKQKADLKSHMDKMTDMSVNEKKSHRMKLMGKMRKNNKLTAKQAHKLIS
jgi:hypothetical protein